MVLGSQGSDTTDVSKTCSQSSIVTTLICSCFDSFVYDELLVVLPAVDVIPLVNILGAVELGLNGGFNVASGLSDCVIDLVTLGLLIGLEVCDTGC